MAPNRSHFRKAGAQQQVAVANSSFPLIVSSKRRAHLVHSCRCIEPGLDANDGDGRDEMRRTGGNSGNGSMGVHATAKKNRAYRLIAIANELLTTARELEREAHVAQAACPVDGVDQADYLIAGAKDGARDIPLWTELARQSYQDRRRRDKIFNSETLFGEPAWDILLDLFIAAKEQRRVSIMSACIGSAVPPTTGLRWVTILEREGLVRRDSDPSDARRTFVGLTVRGYTAMVEYFASSSRLVRLSEHDEPPRRDWMP